MEAQKGSHYAELVEEVDRAPNFEEEDWYSIGHFK